MALARARGRERPDVIALVERVQAQRDPAPARTTGAACSHAARANRPWACRRRSLRPSRRAPRYNVRCRRPGFRRREVPPKPIMWLTSGRSNSHGLPNDSQLSGYSRCHPSRITWRNKPWL
jgi:hypothetical protein